MAPKTRNDTLEVVKEETDFLSPVQPEDHVDKQGEKDEDVKMQIVWFNVIYMVYLHVGALYGLYTLPTCQAATLAWACLLYYWGNTGVTAGAHRLWAHRSYKARLPFRSFLAVCQTLAFQNNIIEWARDHRVHHKYSETDADPHNALRGFFFSHCGWLMVRKHPEVKRKGKMLDISDLYSDPVCRFQKKYYLLGVLLICFALPTLVPWYCWGESVYSAFFVCSLFRYICSLHATWCVNSVAHMFGNKPYDRHINPSENAAVSLFAVGEGYHNYHHTFPQDYAAAELGPWMLNPTRILIDLMAFLGQVTERKKMSAHLVDRKRERSGDGTSGAGLW